MGYKVAGRCCAGVTSDPGGASPPGGLFTSVSAGARHSCGLLSNGSVECWGNNDDGQASPPTGSFTSVSVGARHSCGLLSHGSIECWGDLPLVVSGGQQAPVEGTHQPAIEALSDHVAGIFDGTGCEGGLCGDGPLRRWEMAVWLVRVLDREDPPAQMATRFVDVDNGSWWAPYTDRLASLGVTVGCARAPFRFCPDQLVTRGEMATFFVRAFNLDAAPSAGFADTGGDNHEANIDALAAAGITVGCKTDPLWFCPTNSVTRGEMATFLARALGIV